MLFLTMLLHVVNFSIHREREDSLKAVITVLCAKHAETFYVSYIVTNLESIIYTLMGIQNSQNACDTQVTTAAA